MACLFGVGLMALPTGVQPLPTNVYRCKAPFLSFLQAERRCPRKIRSLFGWRFAWRNIRSGRMHGLLQLLLVLGVFFVLLSLPCLGAAHIHVQGVCILLVWVITAEGVEVVLQLSAWGWAVVPPAVIPFSPSLSCRSCTWNLESGYVLELNSIQTLIPMQWSYFSLAVTSELSTIQTLSY